MGVPKFYRWISERYPCLTEVVHDAQIPEFDNLYLDMNGIIHNCSHPDDEDISFRICEEEIFRGIFNYIDFLFGIIKPKKVFFMAVDGVAPRAKMNQQRARRFVSAKNAEEAVNKARKNGVEIPDDKAFDSNCITPGTQFMTRLHEQLQYFVQMKVTTDKCWQGLRIYLSGPNCPGEGEHKIMDFIRSERSHPDYDTNTRHCLYGLDADLIMLALCSHEPHFALLREEVKFGRQKNRKEKHRMTVDETTFHLLHLSLLREYLSWEFCSLKDKLSFTYDLESVIDDWVLMGFLVGNDFIPHLPHVHIHEEALPLLYSTYNEVLPQLDGYINEAGVLNLKRFEVFLKNFAKNDKKNFIEKMDDEVYLSSKRKLDAWRNDHLTSHSDQNCSSELFGRSDVESTAITDKGSHKGAFDSDSKSSDECEESAEQTIPAATKALSHGYFGLSKDSDSELPNTPLDDDSYENDCELYWTPVVNRAFRNHKRDYYSDKMNYNNISKEELREQSEGYIRAIQWNLHYYYHGCCSWSWYYPHHYAPYISDISDFAEMEMNFDQNAPFKPFEQLLAVLPAASSDCLPSPYRELMCNPESPIIDFYPQIFDTDLNGKKNDWEAVVLIPLIKEDRLLRAAAVKESLLTDEERRRNTHGPHLLFTYDHSSTHVLKSTFPDTFPDIQKCTVKVEEIGMDQFRIPRNQIVHGLLSGVKLDVVFPGFPTMKHLPHTAELHFADIRVFQHPSKKQSMILKIASQPELEKDMLEIAFDLVGKEVHVNWPVLKKALVHELWTSLEKYSKTDDDEIICSKLSKEEQDVYVSYVNITRRNEFERRGIDAGEQKGLALVRISKGMRKHFEDQQVVTMQNFHDVEDVFPVSLSLVVQNALEDWDFACSLDNMYPINAQVFISSVESKYYGSCGFIKENHLKTKGTLTIACEMSSMADVSFSDIAASYDRYSLKWYTVYEVSRFLCTTVDVVNRITGCVYILLDESDPVSSKSASLTNVNIGLGLKFTKRNQIVPDFTRRLPYGLFLYSSKALDMIRNYKRSYPKVFTYLEELDNFQNNLLLKQIFPELKGNELKSKLKELKDFLHTITPKDSLESAESVFVDSGVLKEIEIRTQAVISEGGVKQTCKRLAVKPRAIFMDEICKGDIIPDPNAQFRLLDRVICVKKLHKAPFGELGTIVGFINVGSVKKIDVLFDKPYFGGLIMRSSKASGARLSMSSVINISHGKRLREKNTVIEPTVRPVTANIHQQISSAAFKTASTNKMSVPKDEIFVPNDWKAKNPQASCQNVSCCYAASEAKIGKQSSTASTTHGADVLRDSNATVVSGKSTLNARPQRTFKNNARNFEPQVDDGKTHGSKSNAIVVRRSGNMRNGANFGKVKTDEKIEKSGAVGEVSSCSSYNSHQEYVSPEGAFELRNKGEKPFFKNSALVGSSRDNKNIDNQFRGSIAIYNDGKEMENRKLHHGYSRSWFGNQSVKPETHLPCSSGRSHAKQSISNHGGIQKRMSQKKKNKTSTPGRITLLKKNGSEDEVDLVLPAVTETEKPKKSGRSENQNQETTTFRESNPVEELTQQLSKQRLRSPKNSACSSSTTNKRGEILLRKSEQMDISQKHATPPPAAIVAVASAFNAVEVVTQPESNKLNLNVKGFSATSTPNSTSISDVSTSKRRPRKSRIVANLGCNFRQLQGE